jgi:hypothetical protein|tara:strand:+ start:747 stop:1244 length:498 start_codon:yes stop_codon:yes gene_type:complete
MSLRNITHCADWTHKDGTTWEKKEQKKRSAEKERISKPQRSAHSNDDTPTNMSSNAACGIEIDACKPTRLDGDTQEAIPGLLDDIVVTHALRSENFGDDPAELARLCVVSPAMRDAVAATGHRTEEVDMFDAAKIGCLASVKRLLRRRSPRMDPQENSAFCRNCL